MLKVYGSMLCPHCVRCREELTSAGREFEFLDFGENLKNLKEFLALRDSIPIFEEIRQKGKIGIPCIVAEDGTISFSWEAYM